MNPLQNDPPWPRLITGVLLLLLLLLLLLPLLRRIPLDLDNEHDRNDDDY